MKYESLTNAEPTCYSLERVPAVELEFPPPPNTFRILQPPLPTYKDGMSALTPPRRRRSSSVGNGLRDFGARTVLEW